MFELSFIWAGIIAFAVLTYVILDGFDLGVGILFPLAEGEREKATMMNSIAPIWDGNETWLVLGGGGLFAVFPLAYAVIMPALYMPIILMLLALIFRGVAFEYRWRTERWAPPRTPPTSCPGRTTAAPGSARGRTRPAAPTSRCSRRPPLRRRR